MSKKSNNSATRRLAKMRHNARIKARRPLRKKIMLHPAAVFLMLCTGLLVGGWTLQAHADPSDSVSYSVRGKIPAEPLTEPAIITSPADGQHFSVTLINIKGTCPYQSYVNVDRNDIFAGTAQCQPDGTFDLQIGLLEGANKLQAHVFNITDDEGPLSSPITVYYDVPKPTVSPTQPMTSKPVAKLFVISSEYHYVGHTVGEDVSWQLSVAAGTAPYALNIKWGDGNESNYVMKDSGNLTVEHVYEKTGFFVIKIAGSDQLGGQAFLQLSALVTKDGRVSITGSTGYLKPPGFLAGNDYGWLRWFWPSYLALVLMVLSYWLGERQEYYKLAHAHQRKRR